MAARQRGLVRSSIDSAQGGFCPALLGNSPRPWVFHRDNPCRASLTCRPIWTHIKSFSMDIQAIIPHRPPFLFVDRVIECDRDRILAERTWRAEEDFYKGHYPDNPLTPGVLLCESVFQTAALLIAERIRLDGGAIEGAPVPVLARIGATRFRRMVRPGQTTRIEARFRETVKGFHFMEGKVSVEGKTALAIDFSLTLVAEGSGAE